MRKLTVENFGTEAQGIEIKGNPKNPEPQTLIIKLPFGHVEISRTTDGDYWVHVSKKKDDITEKYSGSLKSFRLDSLDSDGLYMPEVDGVHLAVLVGK